MVEGIILLVFGLTVLAFVLKHAVLHMVCVPAWIFLGFFMWNQPTWPAGNTFLQFAFMILCIIMVLVNLIVALNHYLGQRTAPPTHDEIQAAYKRKVLDVTTHRDRVDKWFP